jgi:hypothetical protein
VPRNEAVTINRPRYRRISTRMWGDEKFRSLSKPKPNGQSLWQFLLTGPQTTAVPGLFAHGEAGLAEVLGWPLGGFRSAWGELEQLGMVKADWRSRLVWIPNAVAHNPPESPNVVRSWRATLGDMPECALKTEALESLGRACRQFGEAYAKAFAEAFREPSDPSAPEGSPKAMANQEQDQEQEQEVQRTRFEAFLKVYPVHEGRRAAWKVWTDIAPEAAFADRIIAAAEQYANSPQVRRCFESGDVNFIKRPKNWLREAGWEDVPAADGATPRPCRGHHAPPCANDVECTRRRSLERDAVGEMASTGAAV